MVLICLFALLFLFVPHRCEAEIRINEFAVVPVQSVEIVNMSSESADISGWYIDDSGGSTYYTVATNTLLPPLSCAVFTGSFNFNTATSDVVRLFDASASPVSTSARLIDSYVYVKSPASGLSYARSPDGSDTWNELPQTLGIWNDARSSCLPPPSTPSPSPPPSPPPQATPSPTNTPAPTPHRDYDRIEIIEIYPCPNANEPEWVKLSNGNDEEAVLTNWYIDDEEESGSSPKPFSIMIKAHETGTYSLSSSIMNNNGDVVRLLDADHTEKDRLEYAVCTKGAVVVRNPSPTPSPTTAPISLISSHPTVFTHLPSAQPPQTHVRKPAPLRLSIGRIPSPTPDVLGVTTDAKPLPTRHHEKHTIFLFVPFSYSFLTIVSAFIKMSHA